MQAASIVYAYQKAKSNADIDAFILAREQDHIDELAQGLTYGIIDSNGMYKIAYEWYKNADTKNIQEQAATVLGLNSISEK